MIPKLTADQLKDFIGQRMRMSHIYQPVMLKTLIDNDGEASVEDVSKALLSYDQSQVEYYSPITCHMEVLY